MTRTARAVVLVAAGLVAHAARASAPPAPACLPPRAASCEPRGKKDSAARVVAPRLRSTVATLVNVHTREAVAIGDAPAPDEPDVLARLLRDRTNWEHHAIAPACVAMLRRACGALGGARVEIVSGYRSDKLNESLRKKGRQVARHSQHSLGHAIDLRLVGVPTEDLVRFVREHHGGGIGYYPGSEFVHIDVGPRREWRGE
jgi:uncharacterized protein YcbK (DUF882 family)